MNFLILGMPNVGKTSIYNLISENNDNIIHKSVGTTRDWHVSNLKSNKKISIYDSPGIIFNKQIKINKFFENLIKNIDIFLYVIDYKNESYIKDENFINIFRKYNKEIILIVNKDDNLKKDKDLESIGIKKIFYISCAHKLGLKNLHDSLERYENKEKVNSEINFSLGIFGKTNVGKSTLLNELVGFKRSIVSKDPKTTTDIVTSFYKYKGNNYSLKDTAGLIKKNKIDKNSLDYYATKKTLSIIKDIDVNIFVIDVNQGFDSQSKKILNLIYQKSNILLFIINKIDLIKKNNKITLLNLERKIEQEFSQSKNFYIFPISAIFKKDIIKLKNFIHKLTFNVKKNINTSEINKWLNKVIYQKPHSRIKGKEVKFKYATQISDNPFTIKIFSNFSKEIKLEYKRYLLNSFYNYFKIKSKNIKIVFSKSNNPFN